MTEEENPYQLSLTLEEAALEKDLRAVCENDVNTIMEKNRQYGGSWKKRGGVGAFMMLARKWDRLEAQVRKIRWDIFEAARLDRRPEGIDDDINDLRRYLLLVEAELLRLKRMNADPWSSMAEDHVRTIKKESTRRR